MVGEKHGRQRESKPLSVKSIHIGAASMHAWRRGRGGRGGWHINTGGLTSGLSGFKESWTDDRG